MPRKRGTKRARGNQSCSPIGVLFAVGQLSHAFQPEKLQKTRRCPVDHGSSAFGPLNLEKLPADELREEMAARRPSQLADLVGRERLAIRDDGQVSMAAWESRASRTRP